MNRAVNWSEHRQAAGVVAQARLVHSVSHSRERDRLRMIVCDLCFALPYGPGRRCRFPKREGKAVSNPGSRLCCGNKHDYGCGIQGVGRRVFKVGGRSYDGKRARCLYKNCRGMASIGLRSERLAKEPIPTTEWEWVLPPFQQWRRKGG